VRIEWKGSHRAPGDEVAPIDLRIDHVYLVSCKYMSRILFNPSPSKLFERLLQGGREKRDLDWYERVAPVEYQALYSTVRDRLEIESLPPSVRDLDRAQRDELSAALKSGWPPASEDDRADFAEAVSQQTARIWRESCSSENAKEALLWRMLRIGTAPYFLLGSSRSGDSKGSKPVRLRVATPWDWRLTFRLRELSLDPQPAKQPTVGWRGIVENHHSRELSEVVGHVEVRWSHGKFCGNPEAKVYLDTPHEQVPGYFRLA